MAEDSHKNKDLHPESLMMSYGYQPELSEGALKCPIFQTSTFVFKNAQEGKAFFEIANGLRAKGLPHNNIDDLAEAILPWFEVARSERSCNYVREDTLQIQGKSVQPS